jgi:hypothetical protein
VSVRGNRLEGNAEFAGSQAFANPLRKRFVAASRRCRFVRSVSVGQF